MISNEEFRRQISHEDAEVLRHLRDGVKGGFDEKKFKSRIGFGCLRDYFESKLQKLYKDAAPATLSLLELRCGEVTDELARMDSKIQATSVVAHLRRSLCCMLQLYAIMCRPFPDKWGKTTEEEKSESCIGSWPGVTEDIKPPNATLRRVSFSIEGEGRKYLTCSCGRGGDRVITEAAAKIARAAARSWLAPLLDSNMLFAMYFSCDNIMNGWEKMVSADTQLEVFCQPNAKKMKEIGKEVKLP
ncbi:hypothetical protein AgCh_007437 [Apium graveolens]